MSGQLALILALAISPVAMASCVGEGGICQIGIWSACEMAHPKATDQEQFKECVDSGNEQCNSNLELCIQLCEQTQGSCTAGIAAKCQLAYDKKECEDDLQVDCVQQMAECKGAVQESVRKNTVGANVPDDECRHLLWASTLPENAIARLGDMPGLLGVYLVNGPDPDNNMCLVSYAYSYHDEAYGKPGIVTQPNQILDARVSDDSCMRHGSHGSVLAKASSGESCSGAWPGGCTTTMHQALGSSVYAYVRASHPDECAVGSYSYIAEPCCKVLHTVGRWAAITSSSGPQTVSYQYGVSRSHTMTHVHSWSKSVTKSVSAGFSFGAVAHASVSVSGLTSEQVSDTYSSTFSETSTTSYSFSFGPGVVWQWQFTVTDNAGVSTIFSKDLRVTPGIYSPPCCVPGYEKNISNPHGLCEAASDGKVFNICTSSASVESTIVV